VEKKEKEEEGEKKRNKYAVFFVAGDGWAVSSFGNLPRA